MLCYEIFVKDEINTILLNGIAMAPLYRLWQSPLPVFLLVCLGGFAPCAVGQSLDFQNTVYFTASGNNLTSSGETLSAFNFSGASATHPLFTDGIYYPVQDYLGQNIWVRVRHLAADPNGTAVGHNVSSTEGSPFRSNGFGGWGGFLFQFDIFKDGAVTGNRQNVLSGSFKTTIVVESIETLSDPEWVFFEIKDDEHSAWVLNSINFTGVNPNSNPGFSGSNIPYNIADGFSPDFPTTSNTVCVIDFPGGGFSEFSMSANSVSQFQYGYEYPSGGGYQGMRLSFGAQPLVPTIISFTPTEGKPGTVVTIIGTNFDPVATNNIVNFQDGATANVTASTTTTITAIVPPDAMSGTLSVTVSGFTAVSEQSFTVLHNDTPPGDVVVFNAVSPNGDDKNEVFLLENIEVRSDTRKNSVVIFNRWGDVVFTVSDYDNHSRVFKGFSADGNKLPTGTYFYRIEMPDANRTVTGFLELKY